MSTSTTTKATEPVILPPKGVETWIHTQFMEGSDVICFAYRRQLERLRELATDIKRLPASERKRHRGTLRKWEKLERLEQARLEGNIGEPWG